MPSFDAALQEKTVKYDNPTFGYRRGQDGEIEKDIFDGEPPEGWVDSPAKVGMTITLDELPNPAAVVAETGDDDKLTPPYDQYGFMELRAEFKNRTDKGAPRGTNTEGLIELLEDLDAAPDEAAE